MVCVNIVRTMCTHTHAVLCAILRFKKPHTFDSNANKCVQMPCLYERINQDNIDFVYRIVFFLFLFMRILFHALNACTMVRVFSLSLNHSTRRIHWSLFMLFTSTAQYTANSEMQNEIEYSACTEVYTMHIFYRVIIRCKM